MFPLINRRIRPREFDKVLEWAGKTGFPRTVAIQPLEEERGIEAVCRPDFRNPDMPFRDARDFAEAAR